ncbi:hypothetical protein [Sanyastnella coralliicola]|uniref:hypothetical protein n=1 Tax=Sanyastnella coralliicola TaxID=3069118 RepID=UPI0027BA26DE|nr:hypothetical protein [Longitalea sp. SCSIO 12813]
MSEHTYQQIGQQFSEEYGTTLGQMFGKPCLKANGKAFAAFFKGAMVFKIGRDEVALLLDKYPGSVNWDPSGKGRPMKDWLEVPGEFEGDWEGLAKQAMEFLGKS